MHLFGHFVLLAGSVVLVYPIVFMVLAGLMTREEYAGTVLGFFPVAQEPTLLNFRVLVGLSGDSLVQGYLVNSVMRTAYSIFWAMLAAMLGGYAFARLRFRGRNSLFLALLATQMIPAVVAIIPTYIEFAYFPFGGSKGILDTWWVYLLTGPGPVIAVMGIFLIKQSLEKVPIELDEAAKVDGAGTLRIIFQILFPLQLPIMAYLAIWTAQTIWNDWTTPFFYTSSDRLQTLPAAISRISNLNPMSLRDYPFMITLGLGVTIPMLLIFFFFQRYIVQGLANAGIKG